MKRTSLNCCGCLPRILLFDKSTRAIPLFNILWAELFEFSITVHYAKPTSKRAVRVDYINYNLETVDRRAAAAWISRLLDRAYGNSQRQKRIKVLVNPFGGQGYAQKWYNRDIEPIFAAARCVVEVEKTAYTKHAVEIAERLDIDSWDVLASCSGDGVPHEVFNGLGKREDAARALKQVAVVQLPCGSGNAMSWNLNGTDSPSIAALSIVKGLRTPLDLTSITQGNRRTLSFLSQCVGIVAESDLGTENIRWMGAARFTYGFLVRLFGKTVYPCDLAVKVEIADKSAIKERYQAHARGDDPPEAGSQNDSPASGGLPPLTFGTVNDPLPSKWQLVPYEKLGNFYAGNMAFMAEDTNFFPAAVPNDGCLDLVTIDGDISRKAALRLLQSIETGTFFDSSEVMYRKIIGYRIIPKQKAGYISIDGEKVPWEPFQAEIHRGLGTVLSRSGRLYEASGP